ncbi:hypothetical protein K461DRAFT_67162 [Myriangium duriaei CBS 260.36]|uniref:Uncharacterized protein n=1 Tax=Myriangium duriaei CBS 260.36 TaxID=1168546 RepID=A0A9P4IW64_9PEZI|nr:hypothetical protein K461DRAFT_67162 [Myriangium duriaei CBS 260.36]
MLHVAGANETDGAFSPTEQYVFNPDYAAADKSLYVNFTEGFSGDTIAKNLGQLVNTLWMTSGSPSYYVGLDLSTVDIDGMDWKTSNTTGHEDGVNIYVVHWPWTVVLIICSLLLFLAASAGAYLEARTIGPDFLGFASTAVRRGVRLPASMNSLSARERMNALQECEVLLQDVRPAAGVGKVALGVKEAGSIGLVRGREYR